MRRLLKLSWILLILTPLPLFGQPQALFPIEDIEPGLKGIGKTVFEGVSVEDFDVEILGLLENVQGPGRDMILARLSGHDLEQTGVFAGMSGSPVYIDGKLVGAVAYAFNFATEAIAGITPIQEMLDVFAEQPPATSFRLPKSVRPASLYDIEASPALRHPAEWLNLILPAAFHSMGELKAISTPLSISGVPAATVNRYADQWQKLGLVPTLGAGSARLSNVPDAPMVPGSTVSVQMVRGDIDISASGTVTHIDGNNIYAFGHPFMGVGYTDMPLNKAAVVTIIPSLASSQKMSATGQFVGSIRQDRATGIYGVRGEEPQLVPVNLKLRTSRGSQREFNFELIDDEFLTPFLLTFAVNSSILASERSLGMQTLEVSCRIVLEGHPDVEFKSRVTDPTSSPAIAAVIASAPVSFLVGSGFDLQMERIEIELTAVEETRMARLERVWQDKLEVKAGEELGLTLFLRKADGELLTEKYPLRIPRGFPPGPVRIAVGDGVTLTRDARSGDEETEFVPENLGQLVKAINNLKKNDRLYIRLFRQAEGAVVAGEGMPGLPPSMLALYGSQKTSSDSQKIRRVVLLERELPPTDFVLTGSHIISIQIRD